MPKTATQAALEGLLDLAISRHGTTQHGGMACTAPVCWIDEAVALRDRLEAKEETDA